MNVLKLDNVSIRNKDGDGDFVMFLTKDARPRTSAISKSPSRHLRTGASRAYSEGRTSMRMPHRQGASFLNDWVRELRRGV